MKMSYLCCLATTPIYKIKVFPLSMLTLLPNVDFEGCYSNSFPGLHYITAVSVSSYKSFCSAHPLENNKQGYSFCLQTKDSEKNK